MKMNRRLIAAVAAVGILAAGVAASSLQIREVIKIFGVSAAVREFAGDINKAFNDLTGHEDTNDEYTKVVPIYTIGISSRTAVGAAQVMGTKANVDKVKAVASPQAELLGREIKLRALIPVDSTDIKNVKDIKRIPGVGVSGIVDLKL
jgi:hypothetical protein